MPLSSAIAGPITSVQGLPTGHVVTHTVCLAVGALLGQFYAFRSAYPILHCPPRGYRLRVIVRSIWIPFVLSFFFYFVIGLVLIGTAHGILRRIIGPIDLFDYGVSVITGAFPFAVLAALNVVVQGIADRVATPPTRVSLVIRILEKVSVILNQVTLGWYRAKFMEMELEQEVKILNRYSDDVISAVYDRCKATILMRYREQLVGKSLTDFENLLRINAPSTHNIHMIRVFGPRAYISMLDNTRPGDGLSAASAAE